MLVDKMDYQKQQGGGGGGLQDDAFYDLLSSTAMANANKHQQQQQSQEQQQHHPQFEQQAFDSRNEEPLLPSYDFQQSNSSSYGGSVVSNGEEKAPGMAPVVSSYSSGSPFQGSRQHLPIPSFVENPPARQERGNSSSAEAATVAAVEQTMKKYMESTMIMMESVTGRIGQLESSTRRLEQMVTDFRGVAEKNQGATGGKLLLIETMLSEVQRGIQDLRTKQEAVETQANMRKLILSEESTSISVGHTQPSLEPPPPPSPRAPQLPEASSYPPHHPHHPHHPPPPPYMVPPQLVGLAPPPPPPPAGHPESHYPPPQQVGPPPPQQGGPPPPQQFYGQQQQQPQQQQQQQQQPQGPPPPPPLPPHSHAFAHPNELALYGGSPQGPYKGQSGQFGQEVPPPYGNRPQQGPPPTGPPMYDQSGLLPSYQSQGRPQAPVYEQRQEQQMGGPPPGYSNPGYRSGQQAPSAPSSGAGGYPRLPSSQPVQHAMPTGREREGQAVPSGGTPLSTNRLSVDEVIDKVAVMGFSKDQVRAVVRRLTENGQSVDLNIVLDKLMNGEAGPNQPKSWFQRG